MAKRLCIFFICSLAFLMPSAHAAKPILVFAASSLTDSYTQLGQRFEAVHPGVKVNFSFLASSTLATQIKSGAPADIFVSASPVDMKGFSNASDYLINRVVLATNKNSKINKISDLNGKVTWIQCAHEVPCGMAADAALIGEGVNTKPVSLEPKVTSALAKLLADEVDAAIVYKTDVLSNSKKLKSIDFSDQKSAATTYQIAVLSKNRWAATFADFLKSRATLRFLKSKGFELP